jgi:hydroxymethylglutaryl-CoA synthase
MTAPLPENGVHAPPSDPAASLPGILAIEVYFPSCYVKQSALEEHMAVGAGKYTIGLGQEGLAITGDAEDINSICLTVVANLLEKYVSWCESHCKSDSSNSRSLSLSTCRYDINPNDVGRLEVGTETIVDKSKSTKTVLMDLFPSNTDIEGATVINACYGGTAALLNAFSWVESSGWDGRYAIVVAGDIATYARGPARPTCGCGAVAVLIGRDAPIAFDPRLRATHASNTWDFFKPDHTVEYPVVDGAHSQECYYRALEDCYVRLVQKIEDPSFTAETPDYFCFHAPYNKLVQKSYGRLFLCDARRQYEATLQQNGTEATKPIENGDASHSANGHAAAPKGVSPLFKEEWLTQPMEETYADKELEGVLKKCSAAALKQRLADANFASQWVGNTYTASVFIGLASLIDRKGRAEEIQPGQSICVFSYGSGALATMYRLQMYVAYNNGSHS